MLPTLSAASRREPQLRRVGMTLGTVKIFYDTQGFGLVTPDGATYEIVVMSSLLRRLGISNLQQGQRVRCVVGADRHGRPAATDIQLV